MPPEAQLLHVAESDPLAEIVRRLNKSSNNFVAEQILKVLGAEVQGPPGTWAKGIAAGEEALAELGLARGSYVWMNGSGLNDTNRFSARQIVQILQLAKHTVLEARQLDVPQGATPPEPQGFI